MKIDCSNTVNFLKEFNRMCTTEGCLNCKMYNVDSNTCYICGNSEKEYSDFTIKTVQEWSDNHQQKTRGEIFIEMFPEASTYDGVPLIEPCDMISNGSTCDKCKYYDENHPCAEYWNEPATTKFGKNSSK